MMASTPLLKLYYNYTHLPGASSGVHDAESCAVLASASDLSRLKNLRLERRMTRTTQSPVQCVLLNQSCLALQNLQCFLKACNLGCASLHTSRIGLRSLNAGSFDLGKILRHGVQFRLHAIAISCQLCCTLVQ